MEFKNWIIISTAVVSLGFIACQKVDDKKTATTKEAVAGMELPYKKTRDGKWVGKNGEVVPEATAVAANEKARAEFKAKNGRKGDSSALKVTDMFKEEENRIKIFKTTMNEAHHVYNEIWKVMLSVNNFEASQSKKINPFNVLGSAIKDNFDLKTGKAIKKAESCTNSFIYQFEHKTMGDTSNLLVKKEKCSEPGKAEILADIQFTQNFIKMTITTADFSDAVGVRLASISKLKINCEFEITEKLKIGKMLCDRLGHKINKEVHVEFTRMSYANKGVIIHTKANYFSDFENPAPGYPKSQDIVADYNGDTVVVTDSSDITPDEDAKKVEQKQEGTRAPVISTGAQAVDNREAEEAKKAGVGTDVLPAPEMVDTLGM